MGGILIAAPTSGAGKTTLTLGLLRALHDRGIPVRPAKAGPDYIDPTLHAVAAERPSVNLDAWAMRPETLRALAEGNGPLVVEAAMGLFDGAADGSASAADLAAELGLNVVLILDCARAGASVAATLRGFATHRADVRIAAAILNRVASDRHERIVRRAVEPVCQELGIELLGTVRRDGGLTLPGRHLGLVPGGEVRELGAVIQAASTQCGLGVDMDRIARLAGRGGDGTRAVSTVPPLGQRIAVANDIAFAFAYPHLLDGWHRAGATVIPFSPLADEAPAADADAIFLPGGYPELHAGCIAAAEAFASGIRRAAEARTIIYGECGGYMVLGDALTDGDGATHRMLGLLPVETSFARRGLHLGYRTVTTGPHGPRSWCARTFRAHEFHHSTIRSEGDAAHLFDASDAEGTPLGSVGRCVGSVSGSFMHLIDRC